MRKVPLWFHLLVRKLSMYNNKSKQHNKKVNKYARPQSD